MSNIAEPGGLSIPRLFAELAEVALDARIELISPSIET